MDSTEAFHFVTIFKSTRLCVLTFDCCIAWHRINLCPVDWDEGPSPYKQRFLISTDPRHSPELTINKKPLKYLTASLIYFFLLLIYRSIFRASETRAPQSDVLLVGSEWELSRLWWVGGAGRGGNLIHNWFYSDENCAAVWNLIYGFVWDGGKIIKLLSVVIARGFWSARRLK